MIAAILLLSLMVVFTGTAVGCDCDLIKFNGTITDADGNTYAGHTVEIKKKALGWWRSIGTNVTDGSGIYKIGGNINGYRWVWYENDTYKMYIDGTEVGTRYIDDWTLDGEGCCCTCWSYEWDYQMIPEFATIAIPVVAILGLVAFYRRKQKK